MLFAESPGRWSPRVSSRASRDGKKGHHPLRRLLSPICLLQSPDSQPELPPRNLCLLEFIYLRRERDRESASRGGADREGERENPQQALRGQHRARCGARTHTREVVTRAETKSRTLNRRSPPGVPAPSLGWASRIEYLTSHVSLLKAGSQLPCLPSTLSSSLVPLFISWGTSLVGPWPLRSPPFIMATRSG